ncbi:hypothetical protein MLD38_039607 [Melastoma candidum]|uniref:Uncharacterized protein n=1 Tax=Melastoma candidum TaxID=119954 RepID=A0ACB9L3T2_9MYRT|nr:hypothetical protein MLD38_039607 [Melastoma candidum]
MQVRRPICLDSVKNKSQISFPERELRREGEKWVRKVCCRSCCDPLVSVFCRRSSRRREGLYLIWRVVESTKSGEKVISVATQEVSGL